MSDGVKYDRHTSESDERISNCLPIRRSRVQCKICLKKLHNKSNLNRHMELIHRLTSTTNKKISKKGTIKKICEMCKDEILENNVDARTIVVKAQTNVDNAKKRTTEIYTIFEVASKVI